MRSGTREVRRVHDATGWVGAAGSRAKNRGALASAKEQSGRLSALALNLLQDALRAGFRRAADERSKEEGDAKIKALGTLQVVEASAARSLAKTNRVVTHVSCSQESKSHPRDETQYFLFRSSGKERGLPFWGQPKVVLRGRPKEDPGAGWSSAEDESRSREEERTQRRPAFAGNSPAGAPRQTAGSTWIVSSSRPPIALLRTLLTRAVTFSMFA